MPYFRARGPLDDDQAGLLDQPGVGVHGGVLEPQCVLDLQLAEQRAGGAAVVQQDAQARRQAHGLALEARVVGCGGAREEAVLLAKLFAQLLGRPSDAGVASLAQRTSLLVVAFHLPGLLGARATARMPLGVAAWPRDVQVNVTSM